MPLDEVLAREGYYKDWTHLDPEVFYSLTQISNFIKTKGYGVDVRLLIAQLAEHFGLKVTQVVDLANLLQQKFTNLEGVTQSFTNNINSLVAQMEADKDTVIANATVDSEVILARGGKPTLQARLDDTTAKLAQTMINVKSFGAIGDGIADDTNSIQEAINHASLIENVFVYIPEGTYMIKAHVDGADRLQYLKDEGGLELLDNIKLLLHGNAVLKAIPNDKKQYNILRIFNKTNVQVEGGTIEGERVNHTGSGGEWGYGIAITGGSNISIKNINIYDCWGDGINTQVYFGETQTFSPDKVFIDNVISNNNRRQGLSIEALTNSIIKNSTFKNTNGTLPSAGIDIEPWGGEHIVENVVIDNCNFEGNSGLGLILHGYSIFNIKVKNCYFDDNKSPEGDISCLWGSDVLFENNIISKTIKFTDYKNIKIVNNKTTNINLRNVENVIIKDNHLHNTLTKDLTFQAGIYIEHRASSIVEKNKNITVINNYIIGIYEGEAATGNAFQISGLSNENTQRIKIKDNTIENFYRILNTGGISTGITPIEFINNHLINLGHGLEVNGDNWVVTNNIFEGVPNRASTIFPIVLRSTNNNSFVANNIIYKEPILESDVISILTYYATTSSNEVGNETNTNLNNTFIDNSL